MPAKMIDAFDTHLTAAYKKKQYIDDLIKSKRHTYKFIHQLWNIFKDVYKENKLQFESKIFKEKC